MMSLGRVRVVAVVDTVIWMGGRVWWFGGFEFFVRERLLVKSQHLIWNGTSSRPSGGLFANVGLGFVSEESCSSSVSSDNSEPLSMPAGSRFDWVGGEPHYLRGGRDGEGELRDSRETEERGIAYDDNNDGEGHR